MVEILPKVAGAKMVVACIVGARPNFMKADPVLCALDRFGIPSVLIHTGQHYDDNMSGVFFDDLGLRLPDVNLGVGPGSHAVQTAAVMVRLEQVFLDLRPALVLVVGDVNSTLAAALTAVKLHIPIGHIEAGLRSYDRRMPEEVNRVVVDALSTYLFTPSRDAGKNLQHEGIPWEQIHFTGNVMIDTLRRCQGFVQLDILDRLAIERGQYALVTLHRPENVDNPGILAGILAALGEIQNRIPVVFPVHPRTANRIEQLGYQAARDLRLIPPCGYLDFLALETNARLILTDSGGVQEEATALGVPCLTLRETTERPITVTHGTNQVVGHDRGKIVAAAYAILEGHAPQGRMPELWDGHAADRIAAVLAERW